MITCTLDILDALDVLHVLDVLNDFLHALDVFILLMVICHKCFFNALDVLFMYSHAFIDQLFIVMLS